MDYLLDITTFILRGTTITLQLYAVTALFAVPLGVLAALAKISPFRILRNLVSFYTWFFRGTPLLLQLFFTYYGLPVIGIKFTPFVAAALTYSFNYGAYLTEIFRAGIESIDKGQHEASKSLGMSYVQSMRYVILPQTVKRVLPPTCNEAITLVKDTALVATIGMGDLLRAAKQVVTRDFNITAFAVAAVLYLLMTTVIVSIFRKLEEKYSWT